MAAVVELAKSLGLTVVAEGVETEEQAMRLRELGCQRAQGFYFARPLPPAEVANLFAGAAGNGHGSGRLDPLRGAPQPSSP